MLRLITDAATTLDRRCAANGTRIPDITEPFHRESEDFRDDPVAARAANIAGAAALQLATIVLPPQITMYNTICGVSLFLLIFT